MLNRSSAPTIKRGNRQFRHALAPEAQIGQGLRGPELKALPQAKSSFPPNRVSPSEDPISVRRS